MALLLESTLRARAQRETGTLKTAYGALNEHMEKQSKVSQHDIFLSHAYEDKDVVLGAALTIEDLGYSVYIDWREDPSLDRSKVTAATAAKLRERMRACKCLFYSITPSAADSVWMKWELGFKDGMSNRTAILPVVTSGNGDDYQGQQFLGIYPYVSDGLMVSNSKNFLWIHRSQKRYVTFDQWISGQEPYDRS
jgi:hypothetical protein